MPVISKNELRFDSKPFMRIIRCDASGEFSCNLPESVAAFRAGMGEPTTLSARTKTELEGMFTGELTRYLEAQTSQRKVILYRVEANMAVYVPGEPRCVFRPDEVSFAKGAVLAVWVEVCMETRVAGTPPRFSYTALPKEEHTLPRSLQNGDYHPRSGESEPPRNCLDWTPEREAMFRRIGLAMEALAMQLYRLNDPEDALRLADAPPGVGWMLPPAPGATPALLDRPEGAAAAGTADVAAVLDRMRVDAEFREKSNPTLLAAVFARQP